LASHSVNLIILSFSSKINNHHRNTPAFFFISFSPLSPPFFFTSTTNDGFNSRRNRQGKTRSQRAMSGFPNTTEIAIKLLITFNGFDSVLYSPFTPSLDHRQSFFLTVKLTTCSFFKTHNTQTTNGLDETQKE
jgi:hypothetical protein